MSARQEWKAGWPLLLAAGLGVAIASIPIYSTGVFMQPLETEYGWTRAQISAGVTISSVVGVLCAPLFGALIDKWGARRVALPGAALFCATLALLSFAGPGIASWWGLWMLLGIASAFMSPTVWSTAVSSRFMTSRGLALAVMLTGTGLGSSFAPLATNTLIERFGWQGAYVALGGIAAVVVLPILWLFFFDARDRSVGGRGKNTKAVILPGWTVKQGLRSRQFWQLAIVALLSTMVVVAFAVHLVPILTWQGMTRTQAVSLAGLVGIMSIIGRLTVGWLFDRLPGPPVGVASTLMPGIAAAILLLLPGSIPAAMVAIVFIGLAVGGEYDAIIYLSTRYFGLNKFGVLFGSVAAALMVGVALGPILAGYTYDLTKSYTLMLTMVIPISAIAVLLMATLGRYPDHGPAVVEEGLVAGREKGLEGASPDRSTTPRGSEA